MCKQCQSASLDLQSTAEDIFSNMYSHHHMQLNNQGMKTKK